MEKCHQIETIIADHQGPLLISFYKNASEIQAFATQNTYLNKLKKHRQGQSARFEEINLEEAPELVEHFQISSLPTMLIFSHGELLSRISGIKDPGVLAWSILTEIDDRTARPGHLRLASMEAA